MAQEKGQMAANGVAYTGVATRWKGTDGEVIVVAENTEILNAVVQRIVPASFDPGMTREVCVFELSKTLSVIEKRTAAQKAVAHVLRRIRGDGRLATILGPGSEAYELLTQAHAETLGEDVDQFRATFGAQLTYKEVA